MKILKYFIGSTIFTMMLSQAVFAYDKEILFRDIPWGSTVDEVSEIMGETDPWINPLSGENIEQITGIDVSENPVYDNEDLGINIDYMDAIDEVAGYPVSFSTCKYVYIPEGDVIERDPDKTSLFCAYYDFILRKVDYKVNEMEEDLINKLSSIYGDPDDQISKKGKVNGLLDAELTHTYWYGANDTMLVLYAEKVLDSATDIIDTAYEYSDLHLYYVWNKGDELLASANDMLNEVDRQAAADADAAFKANTDGL